ncbi:2'-5' RNA ligase family protein, partial [Chroococcidiopsidales cyanobacterium LEGE 13417]|nr:2'-5' RNA ligase family protein [Chroococcidiopsidales cyanobacterium LEGE 13417]
MNTETSLFFVALLPPLDIQDDATQIKQYFATQYHSCAALKSPPHITLQPPFRWLNANTPALEECLQEFARDRASIPITLNGFAAFPPRVIYIDVVRSAELLTLQADLMAQLAAKLGIVDRVSKT